MGAENLELMRKHSEDIVKHPELVSDFNYYDMSREE